MIIEYHRPQTLEAALALLARQNPVTLPLGGGTILSQPATPGKLEDGEYAVVDLQGLGLNQVLRRGNFLDLGAGLTLQAWLDNLAGLEGDGARWQPAMRTALEHEATYNLRQVATLAGTLIAADGRSPLATVFLALEAILTVLPDQSQLSLGELLPFRRERLAHKLVTQITIPTQARLAYAYVARTPADRPIVCAAAAVWPSGRTRVTLGGFGSAPLLAFDGTEALGVEMAARSAYSAAGDVWASAEYRQEVAAVLAKRCVEEASAG